jgi:sulfur carrier protein
MEIRVNGEVREVEEGVTIDRLLTTLGIENRNLAIEHNGEFPEPAAMGRTVLRAGDRLEIVRFVGGG